MGMKSPVHAGAPGEGDAAQLIYARWLEIGARIGFAALVAGFLVYASGTVAPAVPVGELPRLWSLPLKQFLEAARVPAGWGWLRFAGRGDYLNYIGIAFMTSITITCYLRVAAHFVARRDRLFAALAVVQIFILLVAASGLVPGAR